MYSLIEAVNRLVKVLSTTLDKTIVMKCLYFFKEDTNLGRRELRRKDETLWMGGREFSW